MIRVSPEQMASEDKESLLSSQINCFGGNPERTLDVHILYVSEISMSHQIKTCVKKGAIIWHHSYNLVASCIYVQPLMKSDQSYKIVMKCLKENHVFEPKSMYYKSCT